MTAANSIVIYRNNLQTFCILCISSMQSSFVRNKNAATSNRIESNQIISKCLACTIRDNRCLLRPQINNKSNIINLNSMDWLKAAAPWPFLSHCTRRFFLFLRLIYEQLVQISACLSNRVNHINRIRTHLILIKIYNNYTN